MLTGVAEPPATGIVFNTGPLFDNRVHRVLLLILLNTNKHRYSNGCQQYHTGQQPEQIVSVSAERLQIVNDRVLVPR